ncbi:TIR domain-containing protein [Capnocytophaga canis]|uniref:TIR domain-containing protein n=1 Tax=Capnocytophaga canis TaxID=1848903 RepID=UPI0015627356|nr:nucleotide-binding protein [Capnocytophaga canis]
MSKFLGKPEEFKKAINTLKLRGNWEDCQNGFRFKTIDGGIIQWYPSTGKILLQGKDDAKQKLSKLIKKLELEKIQLEPMEKFNDVVEAKAKSIKTGSKIFVVHGHDTTSREQLELILHKLGLEPLVLANTSGKGLTIIEALEQEIGKNGNSKFGIVLLTPDDMGYSVNEGKESEQPRARQNVVLEMGMLISAIGRENTVILKKGHLEVPSDASGILYLGFNNHVKEIAAKLVERLKSSGFDIEPDRITNAVS